MSLDLLSNEQEKKVTVGKSEVATTKLKPMTITTTTTVVTAATTETKEEKGIKRTSMEEGSDILGGNVVLERRKTKSKKHQKAKGKQI